MRMWWLAWATYVAVISRGWVIDSRTGRVLALPTWSGLGQGLLVEESVVEVLRYGVVLVVVSALFVGV